MSLFQMFMTEAAQFLTKQHCPCSLKSGSALHKYCERSIELSWLTQIHDPPVELLFRSREDTGNKIWRAYTATGSRVEYVVWPAVLLPEGNVVAKGVAQFTNKPVPKDGNDNVIGSGQDSEGTRTLANV